jgi:hypothetical protein
MGVSAIGQRGLRMPRLMIGRSLEASDPARRRRMSRRTRLLLRFGVRLAIVVLLLGVVWVEPVVSRYLVR